MCLSLGRLRPRAFPVCHEIRNQRTWYTARATYIERMFNFLQFRNGGRYVGIFHSYIICISFGGLVTF